MDFKVCSKCKTNKQLCDYHKDKTHKDGYVTVCKVCKSNYRKEYRINNLEKLKQDWDDYYLKNKTKVNLKNKKYAKENRELINSYLSKWRCNKYKTDVIFKLKSLVRSSIYNSLKTNSSIKNSKTFDSLKYTAEDLKSHIELQFEPWMTWENWGVYNADTWDDNDSSTWT